VILADSTILLDYLLAKTANLVEKMFVYPERMRENLDLLKGLIFSGQLLLDLVEKGVRREDAYRWVQRNAMQVWETREDYRTLVERDADIRQFLKPSEIAEVFNVERYLTHVDEIFDRVFGILGAVILRRSPRRPTKNLALPRKYSDQDPSRSLP
jgi:adenylosuccinate lyase